MAQVISWTLELDGQTYGSTVTISSDDPKLIGVIATELSFQMQRSVEAILAK